MMNAVAETLISRLVRVVLVCSCSVAASFVVLTAEPLQKGDNHGGGMIVFIEQSKQYNSKVPQLHGVIAALSDLSNTLTWFEAKATCDSLTSGGFTDWTLPGKEDLNRLFLVKEVLGGFQNSDYWSSSAYEPDSAWTQHFLDGKRNIRSRETRLRVRPIRKF